MWLLNTETSSLEEVDSPNDLKYAILSHRWQGEEVTFTDIQNIDRARRKKGFTKLEMACVEAKRLGYRHLWMDTCCIDKSSSAELSEAINSMFSWYSMAKVCLAYLRDYDPHSRGKDITVSAWFTRGWTLQELIAPSDVRFYSRSWVFLDTRYNLAAQISLGSGIPLDLLSVGRNPLQLLKRYAVAEKMSWVGSRQTTRPEDAAYSMLGLFDVQLPLLYGEGYGKAFFRLQAAIISSTGDLSILAFPFYRYHSWHSLPLAPSSDHFSRGPPAVPADWLNHRVLPGEMRLSNTALQITSYVVDDLSPTSSEESDDEGPLSYLLLNCQYASDPTKILVLRLHKDRTYHTLAPTDAYIENVRSRLSAIDALEASERAVYKTIKISRNENPFRFLSFTRIAPFDAIYSSCALWLRPKLKPPAQAPSWGLIRAAPTQHWNMETMTLDIGATIDGLSVCQRHANLRHHQIKGAILIEDDNHHRLNISFSQTYACPPFEGHPFVVRYHEDDFSFVVSSAEYSDDRWLMQSPAGWAEDADLQTSTRARVLKMMHLEFCRQHGTSSKKRMVSFSDGTVASVEYSYKVIFSALVGLIEVSFINPAQSPLRNEQDVVIPSGQSSETVSEAMDL